MSNSNLVNYTKKSPHCDRPRTDKIRKITIHHMAGNLSVETCGNVFSGAREVSANYGIGSDGRVGLYVDEADRAWTSANKANDNQAITIEVANDGVAPDWHVSDKAIAKLIELCVDICRRNGIKKLNYTGGIDGNLTRHNMFMATTCPGPYLQSKFPYIADEVNKQLLSADVDTKPDEPASAGGGGAAPKTIWRVQTGAFKDVEKARAQDAKLQALGYETLLVYADGFYKVQVGAFSVKENAIKRAGELQDKGFATFLTTKAGQIVASIGASKALKVGDRVRIEAGKKSYTNQSMDNWVYSETFPVVELDGDRAVLGGIRTAFKVADLVRVG